MAETETLKLALPGGNEYVNIDTLNENSRIIDAFVKALNASKGASSGLATLDVDGKVPRVQIPEYVDAELPIPTGTEDPAAYLDDLLDAYIAKKRDKSVGFVCLTFATVHPILGGIKYIAKVNVIFQDYVSIEAISYANGSSHDVVKKFTRSKFNGVWGEWKSEAQFSSITYVGTGTYGSNNKNSVTFPDRPKMVFVSGPHSAVFPGTASSGYVNGDGYDTIPFSWSGNTLSWHNSKDQYYQLNESGVTYTCLALYL